jgi:hypothetical protein
MECRTWNDSESNSTVSGAPDMVLRPKLSDPFFVATRTSLIIIKPRNAASRVEEEVLFKELRG